jgi:hypothetical protein
LYTIGDRAFSVAAAALQNCGTSFPATSLHDTAAQSLTAFRRQLQTFLFRQPYPDVA